MSMGMSCVAVDLMKANDFTSVKFTIKNVEDAQIHVC